MTLNDLECPIHLKVHFTDGTLDVRTLWLSDSTIRIGVATGGGGERPGGSSPTLPLCGQLTRCFSAVAELLVYGSIRFITFRRRTIPQNPFDSARVRSQSLIA